MLRMTGLDDSHLHVKALQKTLFGTELLLLDHQDSVISFAIKSCQSANRISILLRDDMCSFYPILKLDHIPSLCQDPYTMSRISRALHMRHCGIRHIKSVAWLLHVLYLLSMLAFM
jgi:hypothetical protein